MLTHVGWRAQVSLKSSAKPGRNGANLHISNFKPTRKTYLVTSRQAQDIVWLEVLNPSHPAVREYQDRNKSDYDDQKFLDHADTFDAFLLEFSSKEARALLESRQQVPKVVGEVGVLYPRLLDLKDLVKSARGARSPSATFLPSYGPATFRPEPRAHRT